MTATRIIDDHIELANIGTKTHAQIEGHIQGIGNYAFPAADGNADQILKTSGGGVLSWINQPAGFACNSLNACNLTDIGTRAHSSLTGIGVSDHHVKYTDAEAIVAYTAAIHGAHVYCTTARSIPNATYTLIYFDANNDVVEEYDYGGLITVANDDRLTIQKDGLYFVSGSGYWVGNVTGKRMMWLSKEASPLKATNTTWTLLNTNLIMTVVTIAKFSAGDKITMTVYQNSGAALDWKMTQECYGMWAVLLRET